jgi:hypothetical protein
MLPFAGLVDGALLVVPGMHGTCANCAYFLATGHSHELTAVLTRHPRNRMPTRFGISQTYHFSNSGEECCGQGMPYLFRFYLLCVLNSDSSTHSRTQVCVL